MANYTTNYNLKKPLQTEFYNIDDHNGNMDIIDTALKEAKEYEDDTLDKTYEIGFNNGLLYYREVI